MANERGSGFLVAVGDAAVPPVFTTIPGMLTTELTVRGEAVPSEGREPWRRFVAGAGQRSVAIRAGGVFAGSAAEARVQALALAGAAGPFEAVFESGARLRGEFVVSAFVMGGDAGELRTYALTLESHGPVVAL